MELEDRLAALSDHLDLGDDAETTLSERVLARLDTDRVDVRGQRSRFLRAAAAVLVIASAAALAVPSSRQSIAGWFGLDGVRVERRQGVEVPPSPTTARPVRDAGTSVLPGPGESREISVDGQMVLVSVIDGSLSGDVLVKTLDPGTEIVEVVVGDSPGLWISGASHLLAYQSPDGLIMFERLAGNTLVWQNDQMIGRLEGFDSMAAAIEYASILGTGD